MALYLNLSRQCGRLNLKKCIASCKMLQSSMPVTTTTNKQAIETFEEKNARLQRPLSPHVTIYKFPLPPLLSITHRGTGLIMSGALYGFSIGMLLLPASFPYYFDYLQSMHIGTPIIFTLKFSLAWATIYHSLNGVRHLAWDMGYGFDMKNLYITGYLVLGASLAASLLAALM